MIWLWNKYFGKKENINTNWHIPSVGSHKSDPFKKQIDSERLDFLIAKVKDMGESFTDEEHIDYYNLRLAELPEWVVEKAVMVLREFPDEIKNEIYEEWKKDNLHWIGLDHHGFGTGVRNLLRKEVCLDKYLPSEWGWDDYYIQLLEIAVGIRNYP